MNILDYRNLFLDFLKKENHKILPSSSLIPAEDKTLMFTNSGMVQFKDYFIGLKEPKFQNVATIQKCLRAGGKHNDLDNVGYTNRHHTFFEMLGHFSFGKYFKEEAIRLAWKCITEIYSFSKEKLYVTVYHEDNEAHELWKKIANLTSDRIIKISTQDNFWSMGNTGPCGPCSEIFFDLGKEAQKHIIGGNFIGTVGENDQYVEIWNSVFMQFEKFEDGSTKPLQKKCIDVGAGLERIMALKEGKVDNYDSNFFRSLIENIAQIYKVDVKNPKYFHAFRIIADHIRAISFMICDNILPGRNGREYVLRRIMRRAMRYCHILAETEVKLHLTIDKLIELMPFYPELQQSKDKIISTILKEEEQFKSLLINGLNLLNDEVKKQNFISGELAFKLYDTYGFPLDLTEDFARSNNLKIDTKKFEELMQNQKEMAKASQKFANNNQPTAEFANYLKKNFKPTEKLYYSKTDKDNKIIPYSEEKYTESKILAIFDLNFNQIEKAENQECYILLDKTTIYPGGGGQVCDEFRLGISKAIYDKEFLYRKIIFHKDLESLKIGDYILYKVKIDENTGLESNEKFKNILSKECSVLVNSLRKNAPSNHTATHILQAVLNEVLLDKDEKGRLVDEIIFNKKIQQKGSNVDEDGLRFDFSYSKSISEEQKQQIEKRICEIINKALPVVIEEKSLEDAKKEGALAFFDEKYGEKVRVISIYGNENFNFKSIELCGGTHVSSTAEIKDFCITKCSSIGSGIIRIEALTGDLAFIEKTKIKDFASIIEKQKLELLQKDKKISEREYELGKLKIKRINENEFKLEVSDFSKEAINKIASDFSNESKENEYLKIFNKNSKENKTSAIFVRNKNNTTFNCKEELLKFLKEKNGSGGGNEKLAQGSF